jgi:hypothetical protein
MRVARFGDDDMIARLHKAARFGKARCPNTRSIAGRRRHDRDSPRDHLALVRERGTINVGFSRLSRPSPPAGFDPWVVARRG